MEFTKTLVARPLIGAALLFGLAIGGASAQEASPEAGGPPLPPPPPGCSVVADGLSAPRFIAVGDDGSVYVTETGSGGDEVLQLQEPTSGANEETAADATPPPQLTEGSPVAEQEPEEQEAGGPPSTRGFTGQVTKIAPDGTRSVLASGFASYSDGVGPGGIVFADGQLYVAVGGAAVGAGIEPLEGENSIFRVDPATGEATAIAELGSYEELNNPDGTDVNPNLYGMALGADGRLYVADAGGNTIYTVDPATGEFALVAVVPGIGGPGATPVPGAAEGGRQAVPTGMAVGADGAIHVALLSEAWPADAASILRLETDGTFTGVANGLSMVVGLTVAPDGALFATQLADDFTNPESPGSVRRVNPDGTTEAAVEGLFLPHGTAVDGVGQPLGDDRRHQHRAGAGGLAPALRRRRGRRHGDAGRLSRVHDADKAKGAGPIAAPPPSAASADRYHPTARVTQVRRQETQRNVLHHLHRNPDCPDRRHGRPLRSSRRQCALHGRWQHPQLQLRYQS